MPTPGSLRDAIAVANASVGSDIIDFQAGLSGTIALTSGQLRLYDSVDIQGPGVLVITIDGNDASRVFNVNDGYPGAITITQVEIILGTLSRPDTIDTDIDGKMDIIPCHRRDRSQSAPALLHRRHLGASA